MAIACGLVLAMVSVAPATAEPQPRTRNAWLRPFASDSIWNTAIGSEAEYLDTPFPFVEANALDRVHLLELDAADPEVPLIRSGGWRNRCSGTVDTGHRLNLPRDYVIEPPSRRGDGGWNTPNNGFAFLLPDRRTVHNGGQGARCDEGGPLFGHTASPETVLTDLYGDGLGGGHGASRMSHLGGAIRPGELSGSEPIRHALDLVLYSKYLYSDGKRTKESTFRWPAASSDGYALDRSKKDRYVGTEPALRMGSLLALHPDLEPDDLGIRTAVGRKLFAALQDYGGYVTDDAAWDANYLVTDAAAFGTFRWEEAEQRDFGRMIEAISVVANNGPERIGGGGTPRRPPLPELGPPPMSVRYPDELVERLIVTVVSAIGRDI